MRCHFSNPRLGPRFNVEDDRDLLRGRIRILLGGDRSAVISIFLHQLRDVRECPFHSVSSETFSETQLGGVRDLTRCGATGRAFDTNISYKEVIAGDKCDS